MNQPNLFIATGLIVFIVIPLSIATLLSIFLLIAYRKRLTSYITPMLNSFSGWAGNLKKAILPQNNSDSEYPASIAREENLEILKKVQLLEQEIISLKSSLDPTPPTLRQSIQNLISYISTHWAFLSFLGSIVILFYIQFEFHVDYFENFRDVSTQKKLSDFYRIEGDNLLDIFDFEAAKGAYTKALEIDPNNELALYRLAISQVFEPGEGRTYTDHYTAERKLNHLIEKFPDDYRLYLLKSNLYDAKGDIKTAREWIEEALKKNRNCSFCYTQLGYLNQKSNADVLESAKDYEKALELDPSNIYALNNLGFTYLLRNDYENAEKYLGSAYYWSPRLYTVTTWGDVALYSNNLELAKRRYEAAQLILEDPNIKPTDPLIGGSVVYNYMPLERGDIETIKKFDIFSTINDKKIMCYYDLSFTYALLRDFDRADEFFNKANALDSIRHYDQFFANKLVSIKNLVQASPDVISWINDHISKLNQNH